MPERPDLIPETYWDAAAGKLKLEALFGDFSAATEAKAKLEQRAASVPKTADEYKVVLPDTIKLPEGTSIDMNDARLVAARKAAHERGLTQEEFNALAAPVFEAEVKAVLDGRARLADERAKLGPKAEDRVNAVVTAIANRLGEGAKPIVAMIRTADVVEAFEKLLNPGSAGAFNQSGRVAPEAGKIPGYETMTFQQRMAAIDQRRKTGG